MKAPKSGQLEIYECSCGQRMHLPAGSGTPKGWVEEDEADGVIMICPDCQRPRREKFHPLTGSDSLERAVQRACSISENSAYPGLARPVRISAVPIKAKSAAIESRILLSITYPGAQNLSVTADFNAAEAFEMVEEVTAALRELHGTAAPARGEAA